MAECRTDPLNQGDSESSSDDSSEEIADSATDTGADTSGNDGAANAQETRKPEMVEQNETAKAGGTKSDTAINSINAASGCGKNGKKRNEQMQGNPDQTDQKQKKHDPVGTEDSRTSSYGGGGNHTSLGNDTATKAKSTQRSYSDVASVNIHPGPHCSQPNPQQAMKQVKDITIFISYNSLDLFRADNRPCQDFFQYKH